jgi:hypothetical protein
MVFNWGWIKRRALELMFARTVNGVLSTSKRNGDYALSMAGTANEALLDLATVLPTLKTYSLSQHFVENMLGENDTNFDIVQVLAEDIIKTGESPKACYFEVDGPCTVILELVDADDPNVTYTIQSWSNSTSGVFTAYRYTIADIGTIQLRFVGGYYPYSVRNIAFYASAFPSLASVPSFARYNKYDLKVLIPDFLTLQPNKITQIDPRRYRQGEDYYWEGNHTLVLDRYMKGQLDIHYCAVPTELTDSTLDAFVPELDQRALAIVPLYIAGKLYAEPGVDSPGKATEYLNEYYARRLELTDEEKPKGQESFHSNSGWT